MESNEKEVIEVETTKSIKAPKTAQNEVFSEIGDSIPKVEKVVKKRTVPVIPRNKIGRNSKCSCGSGKKYKFCCINKPKPKPKPNPKLNISPLL